MEITRMPVSQVGEFIQVYLDSEMLCSDYADESLKHNKVENLFFCLYEG